MPSPSDADDFAPGGSERTRTGPGQHMKENLAPGRRNRPGPPVDPNRDPEAAARRTPAKKAPARKAPAKAAAPAPAAEPRRSGRLMPAAPAEPVLISDAEDDEGYYAEDEQPMIPPSLQQALIEQQGAQVADGRSSVGETGGWTRRPRTEELLELAHHALMYGLRLAIVGEAPDTGTWAQWEALAVDALQQAFPNDPRDEAPPAARFLWANSGMLRMPDNPTAEDVVAVLNLGETAADD